jgi:hypothetical protein
MDGKKESALKYRLKNREMLNEKRKEYGENNKDKIKDYNKTYWEENKDILCSKIECECGRTIARKEKARHFKSQVHIAFEKGKAVEK